MDARSHNQDQARHFGHVDQKALRVYFDRHYTSLQHFAVSIIHDRYEAEDIVLESFLKLWKLRDNFDDERDVRAFLYITVRNSCFNFLKRVEVRHQSHKELSYLAGEGTDADIEEKLHFKIIEGEVLSEIIKEIKGLPPRMKKIFDLIFFEGRSTTEISKQLEVSSSTIRVQKAEIIKKIKLALVRKRLLPTLLPLVSGKTIIYGVLKSAGRFLDDL